jgi:ribose-phosphate pyrophosphokinase
MMLSPNSLVLLSGRANPSLAETVASALGVRLGKCRVEEFPDDELQVVVEERIANREVFLLQPTSPPVAKNLLELLLLADACRRSGAARVSAVIPYFGYARKDYRNEAGEPISARLVGDLIATRFDQILAVDLHKDSLEGFFSIPLEHLSAVPLLARALRSDLPENAVIVSPDLGAVKLAQRYADLLNLPVAYVHKFRESSREVIVRKIIGDVADRCPILVDDIISTGGTMAAAGKALLENGCRPAITVVASHGLLVGDAAERLGILPLQKIFLTDSVHRRLTVALPVETMSLAQLIADAILRARGKD